MIKGSKHSDESKKKIGEYGKGRILSEETRRKISEGSKGKNISEETRKKISINNGMHNINTRTKVSITRKEMFKSKKLKIVGFIGKIPTKEHRYKISIALKGYKHSYSFRLKQKNRMLMGHASYMVSCVKNPSKPQVELFNLVKQIDICPVLNFQIKEVNKCIDIALPTRKIAIEYDGSYWHEKNEREGRSNDSDRQKQIESLGWIFIRYIDRVPSLDELRSDIYERVAQN